MRRWFFLGGGRGLALDKGWEVLDGSHLSLSRPRYP